MRLISGDAIVEITERKTGSKKIERYFNSGQQSGPYLSLMTAKPGHSYAMRLFWQGDNLPTGQAYLNDSLIAFLYPSQILKYDYK